MDIAIQEAPKVDFTARIEKILADASGSRFDNLVDLRDAAQALIDREKAAHEQSLKEKAAWLRKQLAEHTAALNGLETRVRAGKRAMRADAGAKRKKAANTAGE